MTDLLSFVKHSGGYIIVQVDGKQGQEHMWKFTRRTLWQDKDTLPTMKFRKTEA